jgi:hypothetical protein
LESSAAFFFLGLVEFQSFFSIGGHAVQMNRSGRIHQGVEIEIVDIFIGNLER